MHKLIKCLHDLKYTGTYINILHQIDYFLHNIYLIYKLFLLTFVLPLYILCLNLTETKVI